MKINYFASISTLFLTFQCEDLFAKSEKNFQITNRSITPTKQIVISHRQFNIIPIKLKKMSLQQPQFVLINTQKNFTVSPISKIDHIKKIEYQKLTLKLKSYENSLSTNNLKLNSLIQKIDNEESKFLSLLASDFNDNKINLEIALSLSQFLVKNSKYQYISELNLVKSTLGLGLNQSAVSMINKILNNPSHKFYHDTLKIAVMNIELFSDQEIFRIFPLKSELLNLSNSQKLRLVKTFLRLKKFNEISEILISIDKDSLEYFESLVLHSIYFYKIGKIEDAMTYAEEAYKNINQYPSDKAQEVYLNLARLYFQSTDYEKANNLYNKISRNNKVWLEAAIEQAWTQILMEDFEGAAGNMYSLHSNFYKNLFMPESYTVRAIAYLNLCQFGDSLQTIANQNNKFNTDLNLLYQLKNDKDSSELVFNTLTNKSDKTNKFIPKSLYLKVLNSKIFLDHQTKINSLIDEEQKLNKIISKLLFIEKDIILKKSKSLNELTSKESVYNSDYYESKVTYESNLLLLRNLRNSSKDFYNQFIKFSDKEKLQLQNNILTEISANINTLILQIEKYKKNNESLEFEIRSRAGDHLRSQLVNQDISVNQKDSNNNSAMKWNFKGEIWEDEIGHFRSSLKNVCIN